MSFTVRTIILVLFLSVSLAAKQVEDLDDELKDIFKEAFIKPKITPEYPEELGDSTESDMDDEFDEDEEVEDDEVEDDEVEDDDFFDAKDKRKFGLIPLELDREWPNGRVPYVIAGPYPENLTLMLNEAFLYFQTVTTCVLFLPKRPGKDDDYVRFVNRSPCSSKVVGYRRGRGNHDVNLSPHCFKEFGNVLHQMMHVLGFHHEHSRPDRDKWVRVHLKNVRRKNYKDVRKMITRKFTNFSLPYDYDSVMHYSRFAYSKNGQETIEPLFPNLAIHMGQRGGLSHLDIAKLNRMYCF